MRMADKEFVVNKLISLRLEDGDTNIYINNKLFRQCKSLTLNIPLEEAESFNGIESIEEVIEKLKLTEKTGWDDVENGISPEDEFFGHCSNIQAWYESGYDSRILHYSLSFSLLQELAKHDLYAKIILKEEIAKRLGSGYESVVNYLYESRLTSLLSHGELIDALLEPREAEILRELEFILRKPVYIIINDEKPPNYTRSSNFFHVENKRVVSLRLGIPDLDIIPEVMCKFKHLTDLFFYNLGTIKFLPELLKHLFIWEDSDFNKKTRF